MESLRRGWALVVPTPVLEIDLRALGGMHLIAKAQAGLRIVVLTGEIGAQRTALEGDEVADLHELGVGGTLDVIFGAGCRKCSILVPTGERHAILGRIRPRGMVTAAVILQQVRALGKPNAIRAIGVSSRSIACSTIAIGNSSRKGATRNRNGGVCVGRSAGHRPLSNTKRAALDLQGRRIGARDVHVNRAGKLSVAANDGLANSTRFGVRIRPEITARQVATQNLSLVPVLNNSLLAGQRAAVDGELAIAVVLDRNEVLLLERAAVDGERRYGIHAAIADQRRALDAGVVNDVRLVDDHRAIVVNDVIADLALDALIVALDGAGLFGTRVSDGYGALVQNRRVRSARATIESVAVQIERNLLVRSDGDIFSGVSQQLDGLALCSQADRFGQRLILLAADLSNIVAFLDAIGAIRVLGGNEAIGAVAFGNALIKRTAGDLRGAIRRVSFTDRPSRTSGAQVLERTTGDNRGRCRVTALIGVNDLRLPIGSALVALDERRR